MKKIIMILLVVFGLGVGSRAQAQMLNLNYQMSLPLGDQHDFISKMSFRGFSMDYHYFLSERLAVRMEMLSCYHMPVSVSEPTGLKCGWKWETCWLKKKAGSSLLPLKSE